MKSRELAQLGIPRGRIMKIASRAVKAAGRSRMEKREIRAGVRAVIDRAEQYLDHPVWADLADALHHLTESRKTYQQRGAPANYRQWGTDHDPQAIVQMENACSLPVSVIGALMADAHVGYGLPIGGVLATDNAVIPYAVGMDIACRMHMSVLDLPVGFLEDDQDRLIKAVGQETRFGVGCAFKHKKQHRVMDRDWSAVGSFVAGLKNKAWSQLGTSGSGNHFVEFGVLTIEKGLELSPGEYLAMISHSGSRGTGADIARYYSRLAMDLHPELPKELTHLAWLDLDSMEGHEYWQAMELMGEYAAANHELIHRAILNNLGVPAILELENHHNFAWKEKHNDKDVIVHRKGATPAGRDDFGIIPGSMATPGFIVRGKANPASLNSASHGAGRRLSRKATKKKYRWRDVEEILARKKIHLISSGLDEAPMAYKDIEEVMAAQADLVEILARFDPKLVKMSRG